MRTVPKCVTVGCGNPAVRCHDGPGYTRFCLRCIQRPAEPTRTGDGSNWGDYHQPEVPDYVRRP